MCFLKYKQIYWRFFSFSCESSEQEADVEPGAGNQGADRIAEAEDRLQEGSSGCEGPAQDEAGHIGQGVQVFVAHWRRLVGKGKQKEEEQEEGPSRSRNSDSREQEEESQQEEQG